MPGNLRENGPRPAAAAQGHECALSPHPRCQDPPCAISRSGLAGSQAAQGERLSCRLPARRSCCLHPARRRQLAMQEVMLHGVRAGSGVMDGQAERMRLG